MGIFEDLLTQIDYDPFEDGAFLFPWYVTTNKPALYRNGQKLSWNHVERVGEDYVGLVALKESENTVAAFKIYDYLFPIDSGEGFCVRRQEGRDAIMPPSIELEIFETKDLTPINDVDNKLLGLSRDENRPYFINAPVKARIRLDLADKSSIDFPAQLADVDDFIAIVTVPNLYPDKTNVGEIALLEISPKTRQTKLYPQDWFNLDAQIDFGYQWITRAVRNKTSGKIQIQGIRINGFELDETNRQIIR